MCFYRGFFFFYLNNQGPCLFRRLLILYFLGHFDSIQLNLMTNYPESSLTLRDVDTCTNIHYKSDSVAATYQKFSGFKPNSDSM